MSELEQKIHELCLQFALPGAMIFAEDAILALVQAETERVRRERDIYKAAMDRIIRGGLDYAELRTVAREALAAGQAIADKVD
jgi:hypothetical protein